MSIDKAVLLLSIVAYCISALISGAISFSSQSSETPCSEDDSG
jgi:hypothetical protein